MEEKQKTEIYSRVSGEFNVNVLHKYYYCAGISYFTLCDRMRIRYGPTAEIFVRVDHVVVRESTGRINVFLLCSHSSGRCANFLHE